MCTKRTNITKYETTKKWHKKSASYNMLTLSAHTPNVVASMEKVFEMGIYFVAVVVVVVVA